jgi:hypothetical protein
MALLIKERQYAEKQLVGRKFVNGTDNSELILWCDMASWLRFAETLIITGDRMLSARAFREYQGTLMTALKETGA